VLAGRVLYSGKLRQGSTLTWMKDFLLVLLGENLTFHHASTTNDDFKAQITPV
jgi:hypothetical protein